MFDLFLMPLLLMMMLFAVSLLHHVPRQHWDDGSDTHLAHRKLLQKAIGLRMDYSVYHPSPALDCTHLAILLADNTTLSTMNVVFLMNYPTAIIRPAVTNTSNGCGIIKNNGSDTTSRIIIVVSSTTQNNDNYILLGAGVLGGFILLGMGGGALYYLDKKRKVKNELEKRQKDAQAIMMELVPSPKTLSRSMKFGNINTSTKSTVRVGYSKSDSDDELDRPLHTRVFVKAAHPSVGNNLWGDVDDVDIESNSSSKINSLAPTPRYMDVATFRDMVGISLDRKPNSNDLYHRSSTGKFRKNQVR